MERKNIFEILNDKYDVKEEIGKITYENAKKVYKII